MYHLNNNLEIQSLEYVKISCNLNGFAKLHLQSATFLCLNFYYYNENFHFNLITELEYQNLFDFIITYFFFSFFQFCFV